MGMSAGQARLLSITTRLTNNEFRSQTITNAKLRLADDSTEVSNEYMEALESKKLVFNNYSGDGVQNYTALTANSILTFADLKNQYSLVNTAGKILLNGSDIKNYEESGDIGVFLSKYGVAVTDNPEYDDAMTKLYGSTYSDYISKNDNPKKYQEAFNKIGNAIPEATKDLTADNYKAIKTAGSSLPSMSGTSVYSNICDILNNMPTYVEKPDTIPDFTALVSSYNSAGGTCYNNVINETNANDQVGHIEHNLAALIWSVGGLGDNDTETITNSTGTIKIAKNDINNNSVSLTTTYATTTEAGNLLEGLNSCDYTCVQNIKQEIIDLYCDVIDYLQTNSGTTASRTLDTDKYDITDNKATCEDSASIYTRWDNVFTSLSNMATTAKSEYDAQDTARKNFEAEFEAWKSDLYAYLNAYNAYVVPNSEIPDTTDSKYQWYVNLWDRMGAGKNDANGNRSTANYEELDPNLLNNQEWLEFALEHGVITMEQAVFKEDGSTKYSNMGTYDWDSIIYTNAIDIISQEDEVAIAVAEAKYKREMTEIENKDKEYDQDLKRLDTEHSALQTEYESIKGVIQKNVERSFKAFS